VIEQVIPGSEERVWDVCVVGTGPVGMALALELERLGRTVLMLESGAVEIEAELRDASRAEIVDLDRHAPMDIAVVRALGGTSWTWGGRCVAYDDVDWLDRSFVPDAHWPLTHEEIRPWYKPAAEYLTCGNDHFDLPYKRPLTGGLTLNFAERWARDSRVILAHREHLLASEKIRISLKTTVTGLQLNTAGTEIESLSVATVQGPAKVRAARFVLAMGGVAEPPGRGGRAARQVLHGPHLRQDREHCVRSPGGHPGSRFHARWQRLLLPAAPDAHHRGPVGARGAEHGILAGQSAVLRSGPWLGRALVSLAGAGGAAGGAQAGV
jgi:choline dehydrogenase-like flavoprotein